MSNYLIEIATISHPLPSEDASVVDIIKWALMYVDVSEFGNHIIDSKTAEPVVFIDRHDLPYDPYNNFKGDIYKLTEQDTKQGVVVPSNVMIDLWVTGRTLFIRHQRLGYFNTKEEWATFVNKNKFVV